MGNEYQALTLPHILNQKNGKTRSKKPFSSVFLRHTYYIMSKLHAKMTKKVGPKKAKPALKSGIDLAFFGLDPPPLIYCYQLCKGKSMSIYYVSILFQHISQHLKLMGQCNVNASYSSPTLVPYFYNNEQWRR